ncbi:MAG: PAS domain S-box-containing protein [Cyclobacteriaceae bacterium]
MKESLLNSLVNSGILPSHSIIETQRIKLLNFFTLFSTGLLLTLVLVNLNAGLYTMALIDLGTFLFSIVPVFLLNRYHHYRYGVIYFILTIIIVSCFASYVAYSDSRFTDTENIILLAGIMSVIMIDSKYQFTLYSFASIALLIMKYVKLVVFSSYSMTHLIMTQINTLTIILAIYFFMRLFKAMLINAINKTQNQEAILYSLIDNTPLHLALVDKNLNYVTVNRNYEKSFGVSRENTIGRHASDILPPDIYQRHKPLIQAAFNGESPEFMEYSTLPNGESIFAQGKYVPVRNSENEISGITVYVADITELKTVEEHLQKSLKNKDKLFSIIAHDILSPLHLFQNILAIRDDEKMNKKSFFDYQDSIQKKLLVLNNTINNLLQWARAQQKGINAYPKMVTINNIVEENLVLFGELIKKKNLKVRQYINENQVFVDEDHLKLIVRNLLHNAIKFSNEGSEIEISSLLKNDTIIFKIQDFGVGIKQEDIDHIFDENVHFSKTGTAGEMGTGIGLSLCLELAKLNGCEFKIASIPNQETKFEVIIPLHIDQSADE